MVHFKLLFGLLWLILGLAGTLYTYNSVTFQGILGLGIFFNGYNLMKISTNNKIV